MARAPGRGPALAKCEQLDPGGSIKDRIALEGPVVTVLPDSWSKPWMQGWTCTR